MSAPDVSVVIPAYQASATLAGCLAGLEHQRFARARFETIVVDDGSLDTTSEVAAQFVGVRVVRRVNGGAAAARNTGWRDARGTWIAFIDADCVPSSGWLTGLIDAVRPIAGEPPALGAAGKTLGLQSVTEAAQFADLIGSLDAERYLTHPRWPFAPSCNVLYRRSALAACDGFDERFTTYEACDLHTRLRQTDPGRFGYVARALAWHRHRSSWQAYWRQQVAYGVGYAQFTRRWGSDIPWTPRTELSAWCETAGLGMRACFAGDEPAERILRRGAFVKSLAQRIGFDSAYWRAAERRRWTT